MLSLPSAPEALRKLAELGLARHVLGELAGDDGLWSAALARVDAVAKRKDLTLTLGALLAELPAKAVARMIRKWGASNDLRNSLAWLGENIHQWRDLKAMPLASFRKLAGHGEFSRLRSLWRVEAQLACGRGDSISRQVTRRLKEIPDGFALPDPLLTGADLIDMGLKPGPAMGKMLAEAYDAQLNLETLTRQEALAKAKKILAERDG